MSASKCGCCYQVSPPPPHVQCPPGYRPYVPPGVQFYRCLLDGPLGDVGVWIWAQRGPLNCAEACRMGKVRREQDATRVLTEGGTFA